MSSKRSHDFGTDASIGAKYVKIDEDASLGGNAHDDDNDEPLSWRLDPESSLSDWKIVVETETGEPTTYHTHKHILARGDRKCTYFSTLVHTKVRVSENANSTSRITLNEQDATVFPQLLDFLYSGELDVSTTPHALSLRTLANYFQCQALKRAVNAFVRRDLDEKTAVDYLSLAFEHSDEYLVNAARNLIVEHYDNIDSDRLVQLPLELFRSVVCSPDLDEYNHEGASINIYHFLKRNENLVTTRLVNDLTIRLSKVHPTVAQPLMDLVCQLDGTKEDEESMSALESLCKKCAEGIVMNIVHQPGGVDVEEWVDSVYKPRAQGDDLRTKHKQQYAEAVLKAALKKAKAEVAENSQLKKRISTLEGPGGALKCPIMGKLIEEPLKSTMCGHVYSKVGIYQYLRTSNGNQCPIAGCNNSQLTRQQLEPDHETEMMVRRQRGREEAEQIRAMQAPFDVEEDN